MKLSLDAIHDLSLKAAINSGASEPNANSLASSICDAEAEGIRNVGLAFLPFYCDHLVSGAIVGDATPVISDHTPAVLQVDAMNGLAHAAFEIAEDSLYEKSRKCGLAALSIKNAYYNGVEGYFVRRMAKNGFIGFACTNAASMASPYGGKTPVFGTNPLAFGIPRKSQQPLVVDLSTSTTAYVNVAAAAAEKQAIPLTWALDSDGNPTADATAGLSGSLQPLGGAKGTGLALMVEILAAGLSGANWSYEVPAFDPDAAAPPGLGQFYMAIDPLRFGNPNLLSRMEELFSEILKQEGVRLPGDRRVEARQNAERDGVEVDNDLYERLLSYTQTGSTVS